MALYRVDLSVRPASNTRDPQSDAVQESLERLGHQGIHIDYVGRSMRLQVDAPSPEAAEEEVHRLCRELLVNPVLEDYQLKVSEASA